MLRCVRFAVSCQTLCAPCPHYARDETTFPTYTENGHWALLVNLLGLFMTNSVASCRMVELVNARRALKCGQSLHILFRVLNSQINRRILGFGATPQKKQEEESRKSGSREGKTGRPGETKASGGRTAGYHSTAVVPAVGPNFCSLVRTMFVRKFFHLVENPSLTS